MSILITILIFSLLIVIHEFGHFIAAKRAKVKVEQFSIGFGPPLLKIKGKETTFLICIFPLGGYVKLAGDTRTGRKGLDYEFLSKPVGVRARIVFFGPFFNLLLTFSIFWLIFTIFGFPSSKPVVGEVIKYGLLEKSEFKPDTLQQLKDAQILQEIGDAQGKIIYAGWVLAEDQAQNLQSAGFAEKESKPLLKAWESSSRLTHKDRFSKDLLDRLVDKNIVSQKLLYWTVADEQELKDKLTENKIQNSKKVLAALHKSEFPAYRAGLKGDDLILEIDGEKVNSWKKMSELIKESKDRLTLTVLRDGRQEIIEVIPETVTIKKGILEEEEVSVIRILSKEVKGNVLMSFVKAGEKLFNLTKTIVEGFALLITKKVPFQEAVAGPIRIGAFTAEVAKRGVVALFDFAGMLSLSLAIINLFPFPVLDGGHLLFMLIEKLRRKPLAQKKEDVLTQIGIVVLISLMLFVCYNDILKVSSGRASLTQEQFQQLKEKGLAEEIEDDSGYVFWNIAGKDKLTERLSESNFTATESSSSHLSSGMWYLPKRLTRNPESVSSSIVLTSVIFSRNVVSKPSLVLRDR